jgi:2-oxoisovalerate dehydrogenase E1 component
MLIRRAEEELLAAVRSGEAHGTIHACIGQELSAVAFCTPLADGDSVFSNHRCHGHYLAFTGDLKGLAAEIMGKGTGTCAGAGGSQHLCRDGFFSNGVQGGIAPVAAGMAMAAKLRETRNIGVVFLGDGTMGQGVVYETLNIVSKWEIPLLVVCEDNGWAQSTPKQATLAGSISGRAEAFGLPVSQDSTRNWPELMESARRSVDYVRREQKPLFHLADTSRLCAHSRSDDCRDPAEVDQLCALDPVNLFVLEHPEAAREWTAVCDAMVREALEAARAAAPPTPPARRGAPAAASIARPHEPPATSERSVKLINQALDEILSSNPEALILGEDLADPYGGAFKATVGLALKHPGRVLSTPISEAALVGVANGLALGGMRPVAEIMFGDFMTLAMDQIVNHAAKFSQMYAGQASCPVIIRTPMGGGRGYGPTHSQTLDNLLCAIDGLTVLALNILTDPREIYRQASRLEEGPVLVIENKAGYAARPSHAPQPIFANYRFERFGDAYPLIRAVPFRTAPDLTLISHGGALIVAMEAAQILFDEHELLVELVAPTRLRPLDVRDLAAAVTTRAVFTLEEGPAPYGVGAEMLAALLEAGKRFAAVGRIAAAGGVIPASRHLEALVLPSAGKAVHAILEALHAA